MYYTLEKISMSMQMFVDRRVAERGIEIPIKVNCFLGLALDKLLVRFSILAYGEESAEPIEIKYPRDWLESLKERFAPQWLLRRWPIIYQKHVIKHKVTYPRLLKDIRPDYGETLRLMIHDRSEKGESDEI